MVACRAKETPENRVPGVGCLSCKGYELFGSHRWWLFFFFFLKILRSYSSSRYASGAGAT